MLSKVNMREVDMPHYLIVWHWIEQTLDAK